MPVSSPALPHRRQARRPRRDRVTELVNDTFGLTPEERTVFLERLRQVFCRECGEEIPNWSGLCPRCDLGDPDPEG